MDRIEKEKKDTEETCETTFTGSKAVAVQANCTRPVMSALENLIIGDEFAANAVGNREAEEEFKRAHESLNDVSRHINNAIRALDSERYERAKNMKDSLETIAKIALVKAIVK